MHPVPLPQSRPRPPRPTSSLITPSVHGTKNTIQESRDFLIQQLTEQDALLYCVFAKPNMNEAQREGSEPGELIGRVNLSVLSPNLPPPPPPSPSSLSCSQPLNFRSLGYAFRESAWGKGYASEASKALVDAYSASFVKRKESGEAFFIEAIWGRKNPASGKVLAKVGMKEVGWKVVEESAFLGGEWQEPGFWVWGMYL
jgi:RimJ/RimL family protein N-acetyltransferase